MPLIKPSCGEPGCYKRIVAGNKCLDHQPKAYANNYRKDRLPPKTVWAGIRDEVFRRWNWRCYMCGGLGADTIDHIIPNDDNSIENLAPVHDRNAPHCHRYKTAREGVNSRAKRTPYGSFWKNKLNEDKKED